MGKLYLSFACILLSIPAFTQQVPSANHVQIAPNSAEFVTVRQGDVFSIRANSYSRNKRPVLATALKVVGAAAAPYEPNRTIADAGAGAKAGAGAVARNTALSAVGLGVAVSADKIAGL